MKRWTTEIVAVNPKTKELVVWAGDYIIAPTLELAQQWCDENGKGYMKVIGELIAEIPCKRNSYAPE